MSYLLSQLWLYLSLATLLGGLIGWFLQENRSQKLTEIENRWHRRFSDLEYTNQSLLNQLKSTKNLKPKYKALQSKLEHMKKAAKISNKELKNKKVSLLKLKSQLKHTDSTSSEHPHDQQSETIASADTKLEINENNLDKEDLIERLQEQQAQFIELENKHELLKDKIDIYKVNLLDAESKLQVAYEILETQGLPINKT